jgi:NTE family protein
MKFNCAFYSFLFILLGLQISVIGQKSQTHRPKIGLILSGGGAKGFAHIGVLKVLEEAGIRPDFIGGTSMGGIIGGLYAIGYSADSLESLANSMNWSYYLGDAIPRTEITLEEKDDHDRFVLSIPVIERSIKIPGGVVNGQNIENLLNQLCSPVYDVRNFSEFQIPFLCNATNIETGEEIVFQEGYLPDALRATMSIPSIFSPVELGGMLLVDGGLVNNLLVEKVKEMGADILIAVDVGFQYYPKEELNTLFRIMEQSLRFNSDENNAYNRKLCSIVISPSLGKYNGGSFNSSDSIIALGEDAARKIYPQLKAFADSFKTLDSSFGQRIPMNASDSVFLSEIKVEGLKRVSEKLVTGKLQLQITKPTSITEVGKAVDRLFSSLYFEKVSYEFEKNNTGNTLLLKVKENEGGFFRFGLHYDTYNKSSILLNTTFRNILLNGSKFTLNGALGENPSFKTEFFKNNGWKPGLGLAFQTSRSEVLIYNNSQSISSLNFYETKFQIYTQSIFQNSYAFGGGLEIESSLLRPIIDPDTTTPDSKYKLFNYYILLQMDSYDHAFYPTRGIKVYSGAKLITSKELTPGIFIHVRISDAIKLSDRLTLINHIYAGISGEDSIPSQYMFFSGGNIESYRNGIMPFSGLNYMEVISKNVLILKMDLQMRFFNKFFLVGTLNAGKFSETVNDIISIDNISGGYGLTAGYNSLIGPIELSLSRSANRGGLLGFVRIGYYF